MDTNIQICKPKSIKRIVYKYPINGDLIACPHCGKHCRADGNTPCNGIEPFAALKTQKH